MHTFFIGKKDFLRSAYLFFVAPFAVELEKSGPRFMTCSENIYKSLNTRCNRSAQFSVKEAEKRLIERRTQDFGYKTILDKIVLNGHRDGETQALEIREYENQQ